MGRACSPPFFVGIFDVGGGLLDTEGAEKAEGEGVVILDWGFWVGGIG